MSGVNDGGSAFPMPASEHSKGGHFEQPGMSLRDWFAGQAPEPSSDEISSQAAYDRGRNPHNDSHKPRIRSRLEIVAALRFAYADAMLAERAKAVQS